MRIEAVEDRNFWNPRKILLKGLYTDLLGLTAAELQHQGSRLKGIRNIWGGTELSSIRVELAAAFYQTEVLAEAIVPFLNPSPTEPQS